MIVCIARDFLVMVITSDLLMSFFNSRNMSISDTLQNEAYEEDEIGKVAYYLVKNQEDKILFYFSLKCGMLYDSFIDDRSLKLLNKLMAYLDDISSKEQLTEKEIVIVDKFREKLRSHKGLTKKDIEQIPKKGGTILEDIEKEIGENVTHVGSTFSGIELVNFVSTRIQVISGKRVLKGRNWAWWCFGSLL